MKPRYTFKTQDSDVITSNPSTTFKLRAEFTPDVEALRELIPSHSIEHVHIHPVIGLPDCDCILRVSGFNLEAMREFCRGVTDGHVMLQTIQPVSQYTGERDYDLL